MLRIGRFDEAIAVADNAVLRFGRNTSALAYLALAHAKAGNGARARLVCDELSARAQHEDVPAFQMATAYAAVGLVDEAFAALERGCEDGDPTMFAMRLLEPDLFRGDPRFAGIAERVGIEPIGVDEGVNVGA